MPSFTPFGRCIYCPCDQGLTDEHVVPLALGGKWILPDASCEICRVKTSRFEQIVARDMYWPLRLSLGIRGRKRKDRPTHWAGVVVDDATGGETPTTFEVEKIPPLYLVAALPRPGMLVGREPNESNPDMQLHLKGNNEALSK